MTAMCLDAMTSFKDLMVHSNSDGSSEDSRSRIRFDSPDALRTRGRLYRMEGNWREVRRETLVAPRADAGGASALASDTSRR